jgi:hypothetical protein
MFGTSKAARLSSALPAPPLGAVRFPRHQVRAADQCRKATCDGAVQARGMIASGRLLLPFQKQ